MSKVQGGGGAIDTPSSLRVTIFPSSRLLGLTVSYTVGEGGVVALISIVENFGEIQAIVMKLGDFY